MKKLVFVLVFLSLFLATTVCNAQYGFCGQGRGGYWVIPFSRHVEVVTVKGQVTNITLSSPQMVTVVLKTDTGEGVVDLGPRWYILDQKVVFSIGDIIEVEAFQTPSRLVVMTLSKGFSKWQFRDNYGRPYWSFKRGLCWR
jgi:hypothetical protein